MRGFGVPAKAGIHITVRKEVPAWFPAFAGAT